MSTKYVAPQYKEKAFHCAYCGVYANHTWVTPRAGSQLLTEYFHFSHCPHCEQYSIWHVNQGLLLYPNHLTAPPPVEDMPEDVKAVYLEARDIADASPRGAAALLRLALQQLMPHLGETGEHINTDIANLVKKGLPVKVQQALDAVRVIGNNAVHPGSIDVDDRATVNALFDLLNLIVALTIQKDKQVDMLYNMIPQSTRDDIDKRDGKMTTT